MMRNVILFHGHGKTPSSFWLPYTKNARKTELRGMVSLKTPEYVFQVLYSCFVQ